MDVAENENRLERAVKSGPSRRNRRCIVALKTGVSEQKALAAIAGATEWRGTAEVLLLARHSLTRRIS